MTARGGPHHNKKHACQGGKGRTTEHGEKYRGGEVHHMTNAVAISDYQLRSQRVVVEICKCTAVREGPIILLIEVLLYECCAVVLPV